MLHAIGADGADAVFTEDPSSGTVFGNPLLLAEVADHQPAPSKASAGVVRCLLSSNSVVLEIRPKFACFELYAYMHLGY